MPNITYKSCYYLFILQPAKFSHVTPSFFFFFFFFVIKSSRFVGEQIGFKILVFRPAGPDIEPGRCTALSILVF